MFGKFKDLLLADAQSPAMLYYLDNWESIGANSEEGAANQGRGQKRQLERKLRPRGLMELHTLGVDGGYTQKDVTEVSRCFRWTVHNPERGGQFSEDSIRWRHLITVKRLSWA